MTQPKRWIPVTEFAFRRHLINSDTCPECGEELDTGFECIGCGFDAQPELQPDNLK